MALVLIAVALLAGGCGNDGGGSADEPQAETTAAPATVEPRALGMSLEQASREFLSRPDTLVKQSLDRQLLGDTVIKVRPGTGECRPGAATTAVGDAEQYPFACIIEADANAEGIVTEVILGFVISEVDGACWTAQNERIAAAGYAPVLYPRDQALSAANRVEGCVA